MSNKALILFMYLVAVYLVVKHWYKNGGSGMPYPTAIAAPSYLYGVLALAADFTGGLTTVLSVGLTFGLYQSLKNAGNNVSVPGGIAFNIGNPGGNQHNPGQVGTNGANGPTGSKSSKPPKGVKGPVGG